ncbi:hypothetical protein [Polaribacter aestuariivivens]|uniref:hypothetical protein n=1 Tax=Polaribacter aestuariivivens TaxID=2304626 RepID=UPI003F49357E
MSLTALEIEKVREMLPLFYEQLEKNKELADTDLIKSIISELTALESGYKGSITTASVITEDGIYTPTEESSDYTNAGNLSYQPSVDVGSGGDKGLDVTFIRSGGVWTKKTVDLGIEKATEISENNPDVAVSGDVWKIKNKVDKITNETPSNNLFNLETDVIPNSYLNTSGVLITTGANWGRTKLFECVEGDLINIDGNFGYEGFAFYSDASGTLVDGTYTSDNQGQKIAPATATHYAFNLYNASNPTYSEVMLNKGETALPYEPFGFKYKIKESALPVESDLFTTYIDLKGTANDVTIKGLKNTRILQALNTPSLESSRVFNFKTDKLNDVVIRDNTTDDIAPIDVLSTVLLANHSYYGYKCVATAHGKTDADIGSVYSVDSKNFVLLNIVGTNTIIVMSEVLGDNLPINSTLTYVSGGVNTSNISITSHINIQIYPCSSNYELKISVDGKELTENTGKFEYNNNITFQETYNLISRQSIINWYKNSYNSSLNVVGDVLIYNSISYIFDIDGNCIISGNYTFNDIISVSDIMAIQAISVPLLDKYYVPKTVEFTHESNQLNFSMIEDYNSANGSTINFVSSRRDASAIPLDRVIQLSSDGTKGFAIGFLPVGDAGTNRASNVTANALEIFGSSNKIYPRLVDVGNFNSTKGQSFSYVAYRNLFVPENGATANYPVRVPNGDDYYYIDYHNTQDLKQITMPNDYVGREIEIVEQRNITCNSTIVSSKLTVNVDCLSDYGFLVIKVKK